MADQVPAVCDVLATIEARDWERLRRLPGSRSTARPPAYHELRDGRMIRWIDTPG